MIKHSRIHLAALALALTVMASSATIAHDGEAPAAPAAIPQPAALYELENVRQLTARYQDLQAALDDGYVDIGVFYPNMGHHYLKPALLDATFDVENPELLVYEDDPCSSQRRLVAVEYAVPLSLATRAPEGFPGPHDVWSINQQFQLWTLHAWLFEYNPTGVFSAYNPRVS